MIGDNTIKNDIEVTEIKFADYLSKEGKELQATLEAAQRALARQQEYVSYLLHKYVNKLILDYFTNSGHDKI